MDLRPHLSPAGIERAAAVLNYQPFILSNDLQTGVAYSWVNGEDPRDYPPLVFRREEWPREWERIDAANSALRHMYDDFIAEIARRYPGGSLLDVACNNGYFPVKAELMGMRRCAGLEGYRPHKKAMRFLNETLGTSASFINRRYVPRRHSAVLWRRFDVVSASAILCHLPDPLEFLAFLGRTAREAIFFWGQVVDSDDLLIAYERPHLRFSNRPFPYGFNDNTRLSRGLLTWSLENWASATSSSWPGAKAGWSSAASTLRSSRRADELTPRLLRGGGVPGPLRAADRSGAF
jgi:hypothetical protein